MIGTHRTWYYQKQYTNRTIGQGLWTVLVFLSNDWSYDWKHGVDKTSGPFCFFPVLEGGENWIDGPKHRVKGTPSKFSSSFRRFSLQVSDDSTNAGQNPEFVAF